MPVKRDISPIVISPSESGRYMPDMPAEGVSQSDYLVKRNWRYDKGFEEEREGWLNFSPKGYQQIRETTDFGLHEINQQTTETGTTATQYTLSVALYSVGGRSLQLSVYEGADYHVANFTLAGAGSVGSTYEVDATTITLNANGSYTVTVTFTSTGGGAFNVFVVETDGGVFFAGDTAKGFNLVSTSLAPTAGGTDLLAGYSDYSTWTLSNVTVTVAHTMGTAINQIGEAHRGNGDSVPIGVSGGSVYYYSWATNTWVSIGSGYSTTLVQRWQILNLAGYVAFNNGVDLPFTWVVGDASVTPIYEFREQGYACCDTISQSNGMLLCWGITEIIPSELSGIMNGADPYGLVASSKVQKYGFRKLWSNIGDPRDFAAVGTCDGTSGASTVDLSFPMLSFAEGDFIIILGAGAAGGNLSTTISSIAVDGGTGVMTITVANALGTTVSGAQIQKSTAIDSVVGYMDIEDGGGSIIRGLRLGNQVVVYKDSGYIVTGYYTGDLDQPWQYDVAYGPSDAEQQPRGLRFPWTLVDVSGRYHLYAGDKHFYAFSLGSKEPQIHQVLQFCEQTDFFSLAQSYLAANPGDDRNIYASSNGCTSEVFFVVPAADESSANVLAYDFAHERASSIDDFAFTCCATIRKPVDVNSGDRNETWFIMGTADGLVATYGASNLAAITSERFGASFTREWKSGLISFGSDGLKDVTSYAVNTKESGKEITVKILVADSPQGALVAATGDVALNGSGQAAGMTVFSRGVFFQENAKSTGSGVRLSSRSWTVSPVAGRVVPRYLV